MGAIVGLSVAVVLVAAERPSLLSGPAQRGFPGWMVGPLAHGLPGLPDSPPMLQADLTRTLAALGVAWLVAVLCASRVPSAIVWRRGGCHAHRPAPRAAAVAHRRLQLPALRAHAGELRRQSLRRPPAHRPPGPRLRFSNWHRLPSPYGRLHSGHRGPRAAVAPGGVLGVEGRAAGGGARHPRAGRVHRAPARPLATGGDRLRSAQPARARLWHRRRPQRAAGAAVQRHRRLAGGGRLAGRHRAVVGRRRRRLRRPGRRLQAVGGPARPDRGAWGAAGVCPPSGARPAPACCVCWWCRGDPGDTCRRPPSRTASSGR